MLGCTNTVDLYRRPFVCIRLVECNPFLGERQYNSDLSSDSLAGPSVNLRRLGACLVTCFMLAVWLKMCKVPCRSSVPFGLLACLLTVLAGCGGGGGNTPTGPTSQAGTPSGTYTLTVAATSGAATQSVLLTLTVN